MIPEPHQITDLIPQRPPFVMVDTVLASDASSTLSSFFIREDNLFVENGIFREPGMIENIAQTVAAGRGYQGRLENKAPRIGYIGSVKNVKIHFLPKVNTKLETRVEITSQVLQFTSVSGKILSEGKLAAECELVIAVNPE